MSESERTARSPRNRHRQTLTIYRDDHIGDAIGLVFLEPPESAGDAILTRLRRYLGPKVRIIKAEVARDAIEVEFHVHRWPEEAARLADAAGALREKGARRNALEMYREALEIDSVSAKAMEGYGMTLAQLGRDTEALDALKYARELGAAGADLLLTMMNSASRLGRWSAAIRYASELLKLEPRNIAARRVLKAMRKSA